MEDCNLIMVIYKTTNLVTGKIYVGQDMNNRPDYLGSGELLKQSIKKYGKENFRKDIVEHCNSIEHMNEREIYWISCFDSTDRKIGYNILEGGNRPPSPEGEPPWNKGKINVYSQETLDKMSEAHKGQIAWNKDKKNPYPAWNRGLTKENDERVREIAEKCNGRTAWNKGKKGLQVAWNKGKPCPEETKRRISRSLKKWNKKWREERRTN